MTDKVQAKQDLEFCSAELSKYQNLSRAGLSVSNSTDSKKEWKITVDDYDVGHVYVASMGGQVTGRRAGTLADDGFTGCIIIDDPLKPEDAFSKIKRDSANRKILNTVNSRKAKSDTPIIMIMQRLHVEDPTHFVMTGNLSASSTKNMCMKKQLSCVITGKPFGRK